MKTDVNIPWKRASVSIGVKLGNLEGTGLPGLLIEKDSISGFCFLDPEDIQILNLGAILNLVKGQGSAELISDCGAQRDRL